eukprot:953865-Alexandrium_andersonii.AAC.1
MGRLDQDDARRARKQAQPLDLLLAARQPGCEQPLGIPRAYNDLPQVCAAADSPRQWRYRPHA